MPQIAGKYLDQFALVAVVDGSNRIVLTTLPGQRRMWRTTVLRGDANETAEKLRESLRPLSPIDKNDRSALLVKELPLENVDGKKLFAIRIAPPNVLQLRQVLVQDLIEKHGKAN